MVVIVASLFLPFKPQFEIQASVDEATALLESQPIKINTLDSTNNTPGNNSNVNTTVASGTASLRPASPIHKDSTLELISNPRSDSAPSASTAAKKMKASFATPQYDTEEASKAFMQSLTSNATPTFTGGTATPLLHPDRVTSMSTNDVNGINSGIGNAANIAAPIASTGTTAIGNVSTSSTPISHSLNEYLFDKNNSLNPASSSITPGSGNMELLSSNIEHPDLLSSGVNDPSHKPKPKHSSLYRLQSATNSATRLDATASLLKKVSYNLLHHQAANLANNNNVTDLNSAGSSPKIKYSTVITPRSRELPLDEANSNNVIEKMRQHSQNLVSSSTTSMRRIRRKSSVNSSTPNPLSPATTGGSISSTTTNLSNSCNSSNITDDTRTRSNTHNLGGVKLAKKYYDSVYQSPLNLYNSKSNTTVNKDSIYNEDEMLSDGYDSDAVFTPGESVYDDDGSNVPKFGGFSTNAKLVKESLLMGPRNIFNNANWSIVSSDKGNGGLKNAINTAILEKTFNQPVVWVGSLGVPTDNIPQHVLHDITNTMEHDFHCHSVITDDITFKGAYKNFSKEILWPTLHYQIPDNPKSKAFEDHSWNHYQELNQVFADKIIASYKEGDTIWVHDYHLLLVPGMVRDKIPHAKIGFSLHVSFPSSEVFRCLAQRNNILDGMLGSSCVGFQTKEYARHFIQTCNRLLMSDGDPEDGIKYNGRIIGINTTPIGIDAFNLQRQLNTEEVNTWRELIRAKWGNADYYVENGPATDTKVPQRKIILSKDQFDSIRGLKNKFLAYERFLRANPQYIGKIVFIQIFTGGSSSIGSGDSDLERDIISIVDRINSLNTTTDIMTQQQQVLLLHQDLDIAQYLALLSECDMYLINSMREGMNLSCHDFIVCSEDKNSPLLISEFTGSAELLQKGALLINPWDIRKIGDVMRIALEMGFEEKRRRWKKMMKQIVIYDSDNWLISMMKSVNQFWEINKQRSTIFKLSSSNLYSTYQACSEGNKLFLFKISEPPSRRILEILQDLCNMPGNVVYVMNSSDKIMLERYYCRVSNLNLIAENGAFVRIGGFWYTIMRDSTWQKDALQVLESKVERLPGSYIKMGQSLFKFHTENAEDKDRVEDVIGDTINHINTLFGSRRNIHAYLHKGIVFVQEYGLSLKALKFIMNFNAATVNTPTGQTNNSLSAASTVPNNNGTLSSSSNADAAVSFTPMSPSPSSDSITNNTYDGKFSFVCVTGSSSPVLEPLFQYVNDLKIKGKVTYTFSCVYGDPESTNAQEHVEGLNELFNILSELV
ncbi:related to Trehalose synthase complex regulatory subunit TSL1 [Saccharomycodes ludwigii]|uniref:Related to Trehalose synthase complex regulatory subunit TSL1 n=1 Tax=Saccharomycodes ludwigii TaxID=36035 RepID=A0A376BAA3_9ASCO|nr:related to Trehalose synthase complex regulatory subunit TSL1 [Saccharomycodes ludwigii]